MIFEALVAYYMAALSKHDLKPFPKIKTFLLGFAGCCFFQKLPPEGRLNHETNVIVLTPKILKSKLFTLLTPEILKSKLFTLLTPEY